MKAFLMYPDRDFYLEQDLPPNVADLASDLELGVVLRTMADGDKFLFDVARLGIHSFISNPAEIAYRQHVLADCVGQRDVIRELYGVAIEALTGEKKVLGWLIVITGANHGGKSTFLRSVGQAQLMMQAGMFVAAESFSGSVSTGVFTHFKREEDAAMEQGKLDEELDRMNTIVGQIRPGCLLLCNESFASTNEREGSEIARQIIWALTEAGIRIIFVTHLYDLAGRYHATHDPAALFLRAERRHDGHRTFRVPPGEPLPTSYGQDLYQQVFGTAQTGAREASLSVARRPGLT